MWILESIRMQSVVSCGQTELSWIRNLSISQVKTTGLSHVLGRIRRFQKEHGSKQIGSRWAYAKRLNTELARKTARSITEYAHENHADVIVFEYLEMKGKISGKKRQKLHLWKKREIQTMCEHKAHRYGIRVSRVCAWNTSRLAYDGSGPVSRDPKNHSLCVFQSGNSITVICQHPTISERDTGIREIIKTLPETERSSLEAKYLR